MITINASAWGWPQWAFLTFVAIEMLICAHLHGTPRGNYNIGTKTVDLAVLLILLAVGGFFR